MEEVKIILFGPSERLVVTDKEVQDRLKEAPDQGINVIACKWCSDRMGSTEDLETLGIEVSYVGPTISELHRTGWASLSF